MVRQRMPASRRYLILPEAAGYAPDYPFKDDQRVYPEDELVSTRTLETSSLPAVSLSAVAWA